MNMLFRSIYGLVVFMGMLMPWVACASDHADPLEIPIIAPKQEAGTAGLFTFQDAGHIVFVLTAYPGLHQSPPIDLESYFYRIHIDTNSQVSFDNAGDLVRYGGTVAKPASIQGNILLEFHLTDTVELDGPVRITGLQSHLVESWVGLRDDPFIFPRFFGTNVVAMIARVPVGAFPQPLDTLLVWGTAHKSNGKQIDHVGRSNRTMQPRLNSLNALPPREHLANLTKRMDDPGLIDGFVMKMLEPLFAIRSYDLFPDVLIYSMSRPAGFPNGRQLADDVAKLACDGGDCLLWELSLADQNWPRSTENDKPFLTEFPYLAEPWTPCKSEPVKGQCLH